MEQSPSWEAKSCSATPEITSIRTEPDVHYHIHNSPPLAVIQRQMNPVHTTASCFFNIHFNIILQNAPCFF
jgi:hypothetical protein